MEKQKAGPPIVEALRFTANIAANIAENNDKVGIAEVCMKAVTEIENLRKASRDVIEKHDKGILARMPEDSTAIEALRALVSPR